MRTISLLAILWLPSFAETTVAVSADTGRSIEPARRAITMRDLLTHTSGISYGGEPLVAPLYQARGLGYGDAYGWYFAHRTERICETMERLGTLPFVEQPGSRPWAASAGAAPTAPGTRSIPRNGWSWS